MAKKGVCDPTLVFPGGKSGRFVCFWTPRRNGSFPVLDLPPVGPIYFFLFLLGKQTVVKYLDFLEGGFFTFFLEFPFFPSIPFRIRWMSFPLLLFLFSQAARLILRLISCFSEGEEKINRNLSALVAEKCPT